MRASVIRARSGAALKHAVRSLLAIAGVLLTAPQGERALADSLEYQVKAVFLLRFAQFTAWPADPARFADAFVIGILGADPFGSFLEQTVAGERIDGRPIVVRRSHEIAELVPVDLLFVSQSHHSSLEAVLARMSGDPTLTVADFDGFVGRGGIIELFLEEGRVRFHIDRRAARAAGLDLSSKLLRAAETVKEG